MALYAASIVGVLSVVAGLAPPSQYDRRVNCTLAPAAPGSHVNGTLTLYQYKDTVVILGSVEGLTPGGSHGFIIHRDGGSNGCADIGPHFNPSNSSHHGGPGDPEHRRHAGDLGNLQADSHGKVRVSSASKQFSLVEGSSLSVLGRSIGIHASHDDYGYGDNEESNHSGNVGAPVACCLITPA